MSSTVLVTGGAGFVGHHLIETILDTTDWNVVSLDRLDFSGNLNRLWDIGKVKGRGRLRIVFHDLKAELNPLVSAKIGRVDMCLHLAAASHVDRSITHPLEFIQDNIMGTAHILEWARMFCYGQFLYFGTDEIFGSAPEGVDYDERARYNSTNPYSASKAGAEELCVAYQNTYKMDVVITHTMNIFGERQTPEKFIPLCTKKVMLGEKVTIHADSSKTKAGSRFYIHAKDVAEAVMFILKTKPDSSPDYGGARSRKFNIVGKEEVDNLTLAKMIAEAQHLPLDYEMVDFHTSRPGHDLRYALSGELMRSLGWEPRHSLQDRIEQTVDWYVSHKEWLGL